MLPSLHKIKLLYYYCVKKRVLHEPEKKIHSV